MFPVHHSSSKTLIQAGTFLGNSSGRHSPLSARHPGLAARRPASRRQTRPRMLLGSVGTGSGSQNGVGRRLPLNLSAFDIRKMIRMINAGK
jgi:hypothetical protein